MPKFIPSFLDVFSSNPRFALPLSFIWTVSIDADITDKIKSVLLNMGYNAQWSILKPDVWTDKESDNILVAQELTLPSESYESVIIGPDGSRGGFMPGYGVTQRTDFLSRNLQINFIETTYDIDALFFRPWIIAIAANGMIGGELKANATVRQYDRKGRVRKEYLFYNIFPTNVEGGSTLTYSSDDFIVKTVTFGYTRYDVSVYDNDSVVGLNSF